MEKRRPGEIRDAIIDVLSTRPYGASIAEIEVGVGQLIGAAASSSIRSYLRLNTPVLFARMDRAQYVLNDFLPVQQELIAQKKTKKAPQLSRLENRSWFLRIVFNG